MPTLSFLPGWGFAGASLLLRNFLSPVRVSLDIGFGKLHSLVACLQTGLTESRPFESGVSAHHLQAAAIPRLGLDLDDQLFSFSIFLTVLGLS